MFPSLLCCCHALLSGDKVFALQGSGEPEDVTHLELQQELFPPSIDTFVLKHVREWDVLLPLR